MPPISVFFVYRRSTTFLGTTQMRGLQLCETMQRYGSARFSYRLRPLPNLRIDALRSLWVRAQPRGAVYIFIKDAITRLNPAALATLHNHSAAILHDPIDRSLDHTPERFVDMHIASSITQAMALTRRCKQNSDPDARVGLLLHQPDLRLADAAPPPADRLRTAYFGSPINVFLPELAAARVPIIDVSRTADMSSSLKQFRQYNFHYAVRPSSQIANGPVIKPLTKAVTAAACGAPILINRTAHDAVELLGADYRYMIDREETDTVMAMLDRAASDFGGSEWHHARERMHDLGKRVTPEQTARNLETLLESLL